MEINGAYGKYARSNRRTTVRVSIISPLPPIGGRGGLQYTLQFPVLRSLTQFWNVDITNVLFTILLKISIIMQFPSNMKKGVANIESSDLWHKQWLQNNEICSNMNSQNIWLNLVCFKLYCSKYIWAENCSRLLYSINFSSFAFNKYFAWLFDRLNSNTWFKLWLKN